MKLTNPFKKKTVKQEAVITLNPEEMPAPSDFDGYLRRGWAYHARGKHQEAEQDIRQALKLDSESVDALYVLGLVMKAQGKREEAVASFKQTIDLIEAGKIEDKSRNEIMHRLANGHYNELTIGDWNLEKEIWQHVS
jgi:tetratricopeptide (TPR) repeat protein